jgi:cytoskeletal protein CcmA (bactofilin family)
MLNKKNSDAEFSKTLTVIAEGVIIEGKVFSHGSTRVDGKFIGEIISEKEFVIGKEGTVVANVKTTNAVIAGSFKGDMVASGEVEIASTGRFVGKLYQKNALLTIAKGGLFKAESIITEDQEIFKMNFPDRPQVKPDNAQTTSSALRSNLNYNTK